jgi:hypothetical protein
VVASLQVPSSALTADPEPEFGQHALSVVGVGDEL